MKLNDFKTILIIQSIENTVYQHQENIEKHNDRIIFIKKQESDASIQQKELQIESDTKEKLIRSQEISLATFEKEYSKAKNHLLEVTTEKQIKALNQEIDTLAPKIETLETDILQMLEEVEVLKEKLLTKQNFLNGVDKSLITITNEVTAQCIEEEKQITSYKKQRKNLLETIDSELKSIYVNLRNKFKSVPAISFISDHSCTRCGIQVENLKENDLEVHYTLELCTGCGRLLIPLSAKT